MGRDECRLIQSTAENDEQLSHCLTADVATAPRSYNYSALPMFLLCN